jgi:hypothetical protein
MLLRTLRSVVVGSLLPMACERSAPRAVSLTPPKLVVRITVDQLRADLLPRMLTRHGWGLLPRRVVTPVDPRDIAVTLAAILDVRAPSAASDRVLEGIVTHASQ